MQMGVAGIKMAVQQIGMVGITHFFHVGRRIICQKFIRQLPFCQGRKIEAYMYCLAAGSIKGASLAGNGVFIVAKAQKELVDGKTAGFKGGVVNEPCHSGGYLFFVVVNDSFEVFSLCYVCNHAVEIYSFSR